LHKVFSIAGKLPGNTGFSAEFALDGVHPLGVVFASLRGTSDGKAPKPALRRLTDRSQAFGKHVFGNTSLATTRTRG
jgi:hypothetical protein